MIKEHEIHFRGGMNSDDDDKLIPLGDYRMLRNYRNGISANSKQGTIENIPSVVSFIPGYVAPADKHIGTAIDKTDEVAYLIYDTGVILKIDPQTSSEVLIFRDGVGGSYFPLDEDYPIFNARFFDGKIYITDDRSQPKIIDVEKAQNYIENFGGNTYEGVWYFSVTYSLNSVVYLNGYYYKCILSHSGYQPPNGTYWEQLSETSKSYSYPLTEKDLLFIATPPIYPPTYRWMNDSRVEINNLIGMNFQFAYRWIFFDYRKSVFSPASALEMQGVIETLTGTEARSAGTNLIQINYNTGPASVIQIEVVYRDTSDLSTWYRVAIIDKLNDEGRVILGDYLDVYVSFINDVVKIAIADTEIYKPYHYVPLKARFLELIENNHLVFANCTEGYGKVLPEVTYEKSFRDLRQFPYTQYPTKYYLVVEMEKIYTHYPDGRVRVYGMWWLKLPKYNPLGSSGVARIYVREYTTSGGWKTAYVDYASETYPDDTRDRLRTACNSAGMDVETCWDAGWTNDRICFNKKYTYGNVEEMYNEEGYKLEAFVVPAYNRFSSIMLLYKHLNLKIGTTQRFAIAYFDDQRRTGSVIGEDQMRVYLEFYGEDNPVGTMEEYHAYEIKFLINQIPPTWAKYYMILYAGNATLSYYLQFRSPSVNLTGTDYFYVQVDQFFEEFEDHYPQSDFKPARYMFQQGDRIRYIGEVDKATGVKTLATDYFDAEIISVTSYPTEDDPVLKVQRKGFNFSGSELFFEIYRPMVGAGNIIFNETGHLFEVKESGDGIYHGGDVDQIIDSNGLSTSPAEVIVSVGDSFRYKRKLYWDEDFYLHVDSSITSDWNVGNDYTGEGFPKVVDELLQQKKLTNRLRRGGPVQPGTKNNQIADLAYDDFVDMPETHGIINGLQQVGFVLKILQSHRFWSIYIYRTSSFNPDGTESILLTNTVFGTRRPGSQEWGTQDPESVAVHERYLYFWDRSKGLIIRDSANGPFAVSSYKMVKYFRDLSFNASAAYKCYTGFNEGFDEVYFAFYEDGGDDNLIMVFNESEKNPRWTHEIDVEVENVFNIGNSFYTTWRNYIHQWSKGTGEYGYIQSAYKSPYLEFVVNVDPEKVKRWRAMAMHASHKFYAPADGDISTPAKSNYSKSGMKTRMLENLVQSKEGIWYAPIMNDTNTPGSGTTEEKVVNGRPLRGQTLSVKLSLDVNDYPDEFVNLEGLKVMYTDSEKS